MYKLGIVLVEDYHYLPFGKMFFHGSKVVANTATFRLGRSDSSQKWSNSSRYVQISCITFIKARTGLIV
jgi:hypothetical protein